MIRPEISEMEVGGYAEESEAEIDLALNVNPLGPPEKAVQAIQELPKEKIAHYQHPPPELRQKVAEHFGVHPKTVMLTDGCDGALQTLALTYFGRATTVAIPVPSFHRYEIHAKKMGASIEFLHTDNGYHPTVEELVDVEADILLAANPQNPTGERYSPEEMKRLVNGFSGTVIIDEALRHPSKSHANLVDENVIVTGSFSKVLGLAGLRAGYIIAENLDQIRKAGSPFQINAAAQEAVPAVLSDEDHLERTADIISEELAYLKQNLERLDIGYSDSRTMNMLLSLDGTQFENSAAELVEVLAEENVKVVNGSQFRGLDDNYVRISVRDRQTNEAFIDALGTIIDRN